MVAVQLNTIYLFFEFLRIIVVQRINDISTGQGELECEEAIMSDKQKFGRVRTSLMRHLRAKYGDKIANRTLSRINKRSSTGSLKFKDQLN
jgi:hypothetical protein